MKLAQLVETFFCSCLLLLNTRTVAAAGLNAACSGSGAGDCTTANAVCDNSLCKCATGYKEDNNMCIKVALGDTCSGQDDCSLIANAECATTCKCETGYQEENGQCKKALNQACSAVSDCLSNTVCETTCKCKPGYKDESGLCTKVALGDNCSGQDCSLIDNAMCETTCKCNTGYKADNGQCRKENVNEVVCSDEGNECEGIENAECDTTALKCKCSSGYTMQNDKCQANNSVLRNNVSVEVLVCCLLVGVLKTLLFRSF